jgi:tryptophan synthase alpha chain
MKKEQLGLYFTLGDYGLETSLLVIQTLLEENLGLVEIGLPFSDPLLDGTVIQKSHGRSIEREELKLFLR